MSDINKQEKPKVDTIFKVINPLYTEVNGCGRKGWLIRPPLAIFFRSSCNKHDEGYNKGGTEIDRLSCDLNFLRYMILDTMEVQGWAKRLFYQTWAVLYFLAVRIGGKKTFNYKK